MAEEIEHIDWLGLIRESRASEFTVSPNAPAGTHDTRRAQTKQTINQALLAGIPEELVNEAERDGTVNALTRLLDAQRDQKNLNTYTAVSMLLGFSVPPASH